MQKYTPHTRAAESLVERNDKIQDMYMDVNSLFESVHELLPAGKLMQKYSHCKVIQDRMKDQINYLNRALEDLRKPNSSFTDEANDSLLENIQSQISLCNSDIARLLDQIKKAELDNVSHTVNLKLCTFGIPLDSDLNQEAANDILFSYIEKLRKLNISYEKQYCQTNELKCYMNLKKDEEQEYEKFKSETNEMIKKLEDLTEERRNESEKQSQKLEKLMANEKILIDDFQSRMDLLRESSDYLIEKSSDPEQNYDKDLINSIKELFEKLQDPNAKDGDIKLIVKSIVHLSNLKSEVTPLNDNNNNMIFAQSNANNNFLINDKIRSFETKNQDKNNLNNAWASSFKNNEKDSNIGFPSASRSNVINTNFSSFANNSNRTGVSSHSYNNYNVSPLALNKQSMNSNAVPIINNNNNMGNNAFAAFKKDMMAQNSTNPSNNQSYHQIFESLQQKISKLNSI